MGMSNTSGLMDTMRTVLLVVLAFFVSLILVDTIFEIIFATVIFYMFWYYYNKSKRLQRQLNENPATSGTQTSGQSPDLIPPPASTDA